MSVDSEISLLKDTVWRLTGRVLVLENFISKTFGDVLDSSWSSTSKFGTGTEPVKSPLGSTNNSQKRPVNRRGPRQRLKIANVAKRRKCAQNVEGLNKSILISSDLTPDLRVQRSVSKVSYEENPSDDEEDEPNQHLTSESTSIQPGLEEFVPKTIKLEDVSNEYETSGDKNGLEEWEPSGLEEEEDGDYQNTSAGPGRTTEERPETKTFGPLPPPEELPFILRGDYFKVIKLEGVKVTGECQKCSNPAKGKIRGCTNSTSNFLTHIKRVHPEILTTYQSQRPIPGKRGRSLSSGPKPKKKERFILGDKPNNSQSQLPVLNSTMPLASEDLSSQNEQIVANDLPSVHNQGSSFPAQSMLETVTYN